jgi:hypothetical protein
MYILKFNTYCGFIAETIIKDIVKSIQGVNTINQSRYLDNNRKANRNNFHWNYISSVCELLYNCSCIPLFIFPLALCLYKFYLIFIIVNIFLL